VKTAIRRLAEALGQDPEILDRIEQGTLHPAMAAFGLWRDAPEPDRRSGIRDGTHETG